MFKSRGRSGVGNEFTGKSWEDSSGLTQNGHQMKQEDRRYVRDLSGQAFWNMRKEDDPKFWDIKPEDYPIPTYYHQPKQAKVVPIVETIEEAENLSSVNTLTQEKKESIFLTLKEGNIFRKMYEKFVK